MDQDALVTTADSPGTVAQRVEIGGIDQFMGLYVPGLEPLQHLLPYFVTAVEYHHYRLAHTNRFTEQNELRYKCKSKAQMDVLYPTLGVFYGFEPIELLYVSATTMEGLVALGK